MTTLSKIKSKKGTVRKLKNLLEDEGRKVHGISYTNDFFIHRHLCRHHILSEEVDISSNTLKLKFNMRIEQAGLAEIENTIDMLAKHDLGDVPGFIPEGIYEQDKPELNRPWVPEFVSSTKSLYSVDMFLVLNDPNITYKDFTIAGSKFTLVRVEHTIEEEDFLQVVTLLFGEKDKFSLLSHFHEKTLNTRDTEMVLDLIIDNSFYTNFTGKPIISISSESNGVSTRLNPVEDFIGSYRNISGDIVFHTFSSLIKLEKNAKLQSEYYNYFYNEEGSILAGTRINISVNNTTNVVISL